MTNEQQIIAIAKLDGCRVEKTGNYYTFWRGNQSMGTTFCADEVDCWLRNTPNYLNDGDAIRAVVAKQDERIQESLITLLRFYFPECRRAAGPLLATPAQVAESLLRATNLWTP